MLEYGGYDNSCLCCTQGPEWCLDMGDMTTAVWGGMHMVSNIRLTPPLTGP